MNSNLIPGRTGSVPLTSGGATPGLRALRAAGEARQRQYSSVPTGWGRWPTCPCPRDRRATDGSCC